MKIPTELTELQFQTYVEAYLSKAKHGFVSEQPLYKIFNHILYRGCINKLTHLLEFTAFYGNSSSIARIYIVLSQNTSIPNDAERGIMLPINCSARTHVRGH